MIMIMVQGTNKLRRSTPSKKRSRKKSIKIFSLVTAAVLIFSWTSFLLLEQIEYEVKPKIYEIKPINAKPVNLNWPADGYGAVGAANYGVLAKNTKSETPVPIASITKLFTALAVVKKKPIKNGRTQNMISFSSNDEWLYYDYASRGGAVAPVYAGLELSEYQALQAMLLPSANNMADSLAVWAFGSMDAYIEYANEMVKKMDLENTVISDASGFSPNSVSTPSDLIKIGEAAIENPVISEIIRQPYAFIPGVGNVYSTNKLLGTNRIVGGKTGNTDQAGDCYLFMAEHTTEGEKKITVIGVLLNQQISRPETFKRASALLVSAKKGFEESSVVKAGQKIGTYKTSWGDTADIVANRKIELINWRGNKIKPDIWVTDAEAGITEGYKVGSMVVQIGENTYETSLSIDSALEKPPIIWRLANLF